MTLPTPATTGVASSNQIDGKHHARGRLIVPEEWTAPSRQSKTIQDLCGGAVAMNPVYVGAGLFWAGVLAQAVATSAPVGRVWARRYAWLSWTLVVAALLCAIATLVIAVVHAVNGHLGARWLLLEVVLGGILLVVVWATLGLFGMWGRLRGRLRGWQMTSPRTGEARARNQR